MGKEDKRMMNQLTVATFEHIPTTEKLNRERDEWCNLHICICFTRFISYNDSVPGCVKFERNL